ncbi:NAD(P)-binding domain-containing protein [Paucibacter sediminis]|uniref:NAD(P)-binding domain-containing protein n=1 Tax=Paucibacter sediminis TaxID=3019553 RepID=A0AA95SS91_9BURK|nr:NAD(P)-binding domain-containing protein [Paucibacter sp. S2-9]WIT14211.1 NAD(P)-binding domain-containing protein [Paucibacter sp. S2-9]
MKITVIGAGPMGSAFVSQLVRAGHQVSVTARNGAKAAQLAAANPGAKAVASAGAAADADAIILATGYADAVGALLAVGELKGKVVIDITNPLTADYMGLTIGHSSSAAEEIAKALPGVELVKAFNTVFAQLLAEGPDFGQGRKVEVFVASDSERAKLTASTIAQSLGFAVVDAGGLKNARYLEPLAGLNIYLGYGAGLGTAIAPSWIRKA